MSKAIVTCDTTIALSPEEIKKYQLRVLPLNVIVDNVEYHDGVDIDSDGLAKMMRKGGVIKTSTPTPYEIENFFDGIFAEGYEKIVHFTISSKLSSMFDLFTNVCKEKYGDKVIIVDSLGVMCFMLNTVLTAKELVEKENVDPEKIPELISERRNDIDVTFIPESLTYLKRGGRVSPAVALIGNLVGLKPVLGFVDGAIVKIGTTRNVKAALKEAAIRIANLKKDPDKYEIVIASVDTNPSLTDFTFKMAKEVLPKYDIISGKLSVNVEAHAGPGTITIILQRKVNK